MNLLDEIIENQKAVNVEDNDVKVELNPETNLLARYIEQGKNNMLRTEVELTDAVGLKLVKDGITPENWSKATVAAKEKMLDKALNTMLEQLNIPKDFRRISKLEISDSNDASLADGQIFIDGGPTQCKGMAFRLDKGVFERDINSALNALFRMTSVTAEQFAAVSPELGFAPSEAMRLKWETELNGLGDLVNDDIRIPVDGEVMKYCRHLTEQFKQGYNYALRNAGK